MVVTDGVGVGSEAADAGAGVGGLTFCGSVGAPTELFEATGCIFSLRIQ
jgi:hypothetical protein